MSACIIYNPSAGSAEQLQALLRRIEKRPQTELAATRRADDAPELAQQAVEHGHRLIIAAGGDGTINGVVNGLMQCGADVTLAVIPLGTGNDLPRTLAIPDDPLEALDLVARAQVRRIDLIKVRMGKKTLYGHNVAAGGFTGEVNEATTDEIKQRWGPLAYLRGAVSALPDLARYETTIRFDAKPPMQLHAINIIVANGRMAGGGMAVAPHANPEDGLLDVITVRAGNAFELTDVAMRLFAGDYTTSDTVTMRRAKRVEVHSRPQMAFNLDGELLARSKLVFSVVPKALRVIVGPDYRADVKPSN